MQFSAQYDSTLVILSLFLAVCGAHVALGIAERISHPKERRRTVYVWGGAGVMGVAIWSMHYVGMLALHLPVTVRFDLPLVLLSIGVAIIASAVAFILTGQPQLKPFRLGLGAVAMGSGIALMHYIGMAAMRMQCIILWSRGIVCLSVVIAVIVSAVALATFRFSSGIKGYYKFLAACILGAAISSMHWVGMAAAHFQQSGTVPDFHGTISESALGGAGIAAVSLAMLALARGSSLLSEYISNQSQRLETSEERYRLLFDKCLAGIYRMGFDGSLLDINEAGAKLLGYGDRQELIGTNLVSRHFSTLDAQMFSGLASRRLELPPREMELLARDGRKRFVLHSATTIESSPPESGEVHGFFLSIDDLKRTQNDLLEAHLLAEAGNVAKRQFMTKMSHELRTPLNGLLGMTGLLLDGELSEQQREYLLLVRQTGEELFDALSEILLYADESSPKPDAQWEEFLLQDLIWEEIRAITPRAQRKGLTIDCEMKDLNSQRFFSDSKRLRHILSALLSNALKFTDSGRIEVWASSRPSFVSSYPMVTIAVSDTGIGIPRELQATIFEPFAEANTMLRTEAKGTGLGLATVRSAVSALHGTVKFESEPGKGSKFIVEIPMRAAPSNVIPSVPAEPILV